MNPIENEQLCKTTSECLRHGVGSLSDFPGLLKKIIKERAWEQRKIKTGQIVELRNLSELITEKPLRGWGEDPKKVEAVIKDDPKVLAMFREAMKHPGERTDLCNNVTGVKKPTGNSKAYTVSRLERQAPELFEAVCRGEMSANAAAIKAGFRKKPSPDETAVAAWKKAENRLHVLKQILSELKPHEKEVIKEWL